MVTKWSLVWQFPLAQYTFMDICQSAIGKCNGQDKQNTAAVAITVWGISVMNQAIGPLLTVFCLSWRIYIRDIWGVLSVLLGYYIPGIQCTFTCDIHPRSYAVTRIHVFVLTTLPSTTQVYQQHSPIVITIWLFALVSSSLFASLYLHSECRITILWVLWIDNTIQCSGCNVACIRCLIQGLIMMQILRVMGWLRDSCRDGNAGPQRNNIDLMAHSSWNYRKVGLYFTKFLLVSSDMGVIDSLDTITPKIPQKCDYYFQNIIFPSSDMGVIESLDTTSPKILQKCEYIFNQNIILSSPELEISSFDCTFTSYLNKYFTSHYTHDGQSLLHSSQVVKEDFYCFVMFNWETTAAVLNDKVAFKVTFSRMNLISPHLIYNVNSQVSINEPTLPQPFMLLTKMSQRTWKTWSRRLSRWPEKCRWAFNTWNWG